MVRLTADLIRKKSEHNDGTMAELEEIALHQLEIEKIETIGSVCRRLKILYLQNNIISKIENLQHLKELEYLNLALNNITKIEGLESCEFLSKLDLTVNFIPLSNLESSLRNLQHNKNLKELYLVGNPCADWNGCKDFVIHYLPWLERLDGNRITKSEQIQAAQRVESLRGELASLVEEEVAKNLESKCKIEELDDSENAPYTPELRTAMYREMAEEKAEKEARDKERLPKERDYEKEHMEAVEQARAKHYFADGRIRQCNEAGLEFRFDEDKDSFFLFVQLPRYVDTSLIDCQVFPRFVQVIFKDKTLRLAVPGGEEEEVQADNARCERSKTTGELKVIMPKVNPSDMLVLGSKEAENDLNKKNSADSSRVRRLEKPLHRGEQMLAEAVNIKTIYQGPENPNLGAGAAISVSSEVPLALKAQQHLESALHVPGLEDDDSDDE